MSLIDALFLDPQPLEFWLSIRTDNVFGSGTISDPWNCTTAALFDARMTGLPANARVHLGPGTFSTNGYADGVTGGWQPKKGMKILGSGINVTTLKLTGASDTVPNKHFFAIGHVLTTGSGPIVLNSMDYLDVADMTINANLAAQSGSTFACGAVRVMGDHVRVRRVQVVGWGTKTSAVPCYAIAAITAVASAGPVGITDCGIEECVVVTPASSPTAARLTALHCGSSDESGLTMPEAYGVSPFIRNCFVDCGWPTAVSEFHGLSMSWCRGGIIEGNQIHNTTYGGPYSELVTIRDIIVRNNYYKNVAKGPFLNLGKLTPASPVSLTSLVPDSGDNSIAVGTTSGSHGLQAWDRIKINGASGTPSQYIGTFVIKDTTPTTFRYQMTLATSQSAISPTVQKVFGAGKVLIERNTIELVTGSSGLTAIHLHDQGSPGGPAPTPGYVFGDVLIRQNTVRYLDGAAPTSTTDLACQVNGAKNLIVSHNIIDSANPRPVQNQRCSSVRYFNNEAPSGVLLEGVNGDSGRKYTELETDSDFALVMSLFNRKYG